MKLKLLLLSFSAILAQSCYYDNAEELYGNIPKDCDTSAVSYKLDVQPILSNQCYSCHGEVVQQAGLDLRTYTTVKANALSIKDRINRNASDPLLMPQGSPMSTCNIQLVTTWVNQGAQDN